MYHFCSENRLSKILFSNPFPKKRSDCEFQKSGFEFDPKNPPGVWILWIHDPFLDLSKKNAKSVFGFRNWRIWIFPKKRTQCRNNVATEWCAKNRCCELSLVTSPLATTTRRQRERKNNNRVYWTKQQVCTYITLLCTFVTARQGRENAWFYVLWRT